LNNMSIIFPRRKAAKSEHASRPARRSYALLLLLGCSLLVHVAPICAELTCFCASQLAANACAFRCQPLLHI
jgi:hypothetical protein